MTSDITMTNADFLLTRPLGMNFSGVFFGQQTNIFFQENAFEQYSLQNISYFVLGGNEINWKGKNYFQSQTQVNN